MAKQNKYPTDSNVDRNDRLTGLNSESSQTKNYFVGDLSDFIKSEIEAVIGLYKIGDYLVDRKGGSNTTEILQGNIIYGTGSFFNGEYIIAEALQDSPTQDSHFKQPIIQSL